MFAFDNVCTSTRIEKAQKYFLCAFDLNLFNWNDIFEEFCVSYEKSQSLQAELMKKTVNHPIVLKLPIKVSYQQNFLKKVISYLENNNIEVSDKVYNRYVQLLQKTDNEKNSHYRHFILPNNRCVSLCESKSVISEGTTGLYSWQGSFALSEWLIKNNEELQGKTILELGSGVGLAGLILLSIGKSYCYCFSDCHQKVLETLKLNVILNMENNGSGNVVNENYYHKEQHEESDYIYWKSMFDKSHVQILNLPWESVENLDIELKPDVIIASDIVYDERLFPSLCNALEYFLNNKDVYALLVCTIRNESTFNKFLSVLASRNFSVIPEVAAKSKYMLFSNETPIKFLKIYKMDS